MGHKPGLSGMFAGSWEERPPLVLQTLEGLAVASPDGPVLGAGAERLFPLLMAIASAPAGRTRLELGALLYPRLSQSEQLQMIRKRLYTLGEHLPAGSLAVDRDSARLRRPLALDIEGAGWWAAYLAVRRQGDRRRLALAPIAAAFPEPAASVELEEILQGVDSQIRRALWERFHAEFANAEAIAHLPTPVAVDAIVDYLSAADAAPKVPEALDAIMEGGQIGAACLAVSQMLQAMPPEEEQTVEQQMLVAQLGRWSVRVTKAHGGLTGPVLEGRAVELCQLLAAQAALRARAGVRVILVDGASGLGRTTLLRVFTQLAKRARGAATIVLTVQLRATMNAQPYSGFRALVRELHETPGRSSMNDAEMRVIQEILTDPLSVGTRPIAHTIAAFRELLEAVLEESLDPHPALVFAVDDVQWLDVESRDLLLRLAHELAALPIMVVLSTTEPERVIEMVAGMPLTRLSVAPLTDAQARVVLEQRIAARFLADADVEHINRVAGGRPRDLVRIAAGLQVHGVGSASVMQTMAAYVTQQVQAMVPAMRQALTVAAMLGPLATPARVARVGVLAKSEALEPLITALQGEGWVECVERPVVSDTLTEPIIAALPSVLRRVLWRQVAHALEAEVREAPSLLRSEVAWQIVRAWGDAGEPARAIATGLTIGEALIRAQRIDYGEDVLAHVEALARQVHGSEGVMAVRRAWMIALCDAQTRNRAAARLALWQAAAAEQTGDPLGAAGHLAVEATFRWYTGAAMAGAPALPRVVEVVSELSTPVSMRVALFADAVLEKWLSGAECDGVETADWILRLPGSTDVGSLEAVLLLRAQVFAATLLRRVEVMRSLRDRYLFLAEGLAHASPCAYAAAVLDVWVCQRRLRSPHRFTEVMRRARRLAADASAESLALALWACECYDGLEGVLEREGSDVEQEAALAALGVIGSEWRARQVGLPSVQMGHVVAPLLSLVDAVMRGQSGWEPLARAAVSPRSSGWWPVVGADAPVASTVFGSPAATAGRADPVPHDMWRKSPLWVRRWQEGVAAWAGAPDWIAFAQFQRDLQQGVSLEQQALVLARASDGEGPFAELLAASVALWKDAVPHPMLMRLWSSDLVRQCGAAFSAQLHGLCAAQWGQPVGEEYRTVTKTQAHVWGGLDREVPMPLMRDGQGASAHDARARLSRSESVATVNVQ